MGLEHRIKGIARKGRIELEEGACLPEGAEVTVLFEEANPRRTIDPTKWAESLKIIESFKGKLPILPDAAYSTDALYG